MEEAQQIRVHRLSNEASCTEVEPTKTEAKQWSRGPPTEQETKYHYWKTIFLKNLLQTERLQTAIYIS